MKRILIKLIQKQFLILGLAFNSVAGFSQFSLGDLNHIIGYGQSLSLGSVDSCIITTTQKYNTVMFSKELRTLDYASSDFSAATLVPLIEKVWVNRANYAESPYSGMSEMLIETIIKENGSFNKQFLFQAAGRGGTSITGLNKGTTTAHTYEYVVLGTQTGKRLATAADKTYKVPCFTWIQGEQDLTTYMPPATYKSLLTQLQQDIQTDVQQINGQTEPVRCVFSQTASYNRYWMLRTGTTTDSLPNYKISVALYQMALENPDKFTLSTTMYPFIYGLDNVHMRAETSKLVGAYYGYTIKKAVIDGVPMLPIHPIKYTISGNELVVKFYVPNKPLALDTKQVRFIENYGFNLYRGETEIGIQSVQLISEDEIKFTCSETVQTGDFITYAINGLTTGALNGARGNLRDSRGEAVTFTIGCTIHKLHNWCPILKETITASL